jgi:hypothetical protein
MKRSIYLSIYLFISVCLSACLCTSVSDSSYFCQQLGHLKQMLAETQQHLEQQKDETPESFRQDTPHMERHQPTLQDVMDRYKY